MSKNFLYKALRKIRQIDLACWRGDKVTWPELHLLGCLSDYIDAVDPAEVDGVWRRVVREIPLVKHG